MSLLESGRKDPQIFYASGFLYTPGAGSDEPRTALNESKFAGASSPTTLNLCGFGSYLGGGSGINPERLAVRNGAVSFFKRVA